MTESIGHNSGSTSASSESTPVLDRVSETPASIRDLTVDELKQLGGEVRRETIDAVSRTGGHLEIGRAHV